MLTRIVTSRANHPPFIKPFSNERAADMTNGSNSTDNSTSFDIHEDNDDSITIVRESELVSLCETLQHKISDQDKIIRKLILGSYESIINAIEAKDQYTAGHSRRVAAISEILAQIIGINKNDLEDLHWGALLHDVGKIAIDPAIQNKPDKLTEDEYKQIMLHTQIGPDIVRPIVNNKIMEIIRYHHSRFDGQGINQINEGVKIPIGARIVAVADTYDAMTTDRPYRKALSREFAFQEISKCSGTQFDPDISSVFVKIGDILLKPENIDRKIQDTIDI